MAKTTFALAALLVFASVLVFGFDPGSIHHALLFDPIGISAAAAMMMPAARQVLIPGPRGIQSVRADATSESIATLTKTIEALSARLEDSSETAVKPADVEALRAEHTKLVAALDDVSKQVTALKLNPYGSGIRTHVPHKKLKAFKGDHAEDLAYKTGMWLAAAIWGNAIAGAWCKEHNLGLVVDESKDKPAMSGPGSRIDARVFAAASENVNTTGGFIVPQELERTIIDLREEYGTARRWARTYQMGADTLKIPRRASGLNAYFVGDGTAATESQKGWDGVELVAKKAMVLTRFPTELAEDAIINVADDLVQEVAYAFAVLEDACFWNGDGSITYGGIQGVRGKIVGKTGGVVAATNNDTFAEFTLADHEAVMGTLPLYAWRNARWFMSIPYFNLVINRLGYAAAGTAVDQIAGPGGLRKYALGMPVEWDQTLPLASATDYSNLAVAFFGDPSLAVAMGTRRGVTIRQSDQRYFDTDQIGIMGTERFDIVAHGLGDFTAVDGTTAVAGPLVALVGQ